MKSNYETLKLTDPCLRNWFVRQWGEDFEFDSVTELIKEIKKLESPCIVEDVANLICSVPELQTNEMLEFFISLNPSEYEET